jgi:tol-pal system protein YbgF
MRAARGLRAALLSLLLGLAAGAGHAALFGDDEARKAILELRERVRVGEEQSAARAAELTAANAQLSEQLAALRRSLLDLNNQIETLRGEVARLRGSDEQVMRDLAELQRSQKDATQALDGRLARFEPAKVTIDGREFLAEPAEKAAYEDAITALRAGDFDKSATQLTEFLRRYPQSGYADSARFWLGNALYGKRQYKEAIAAFRSFVNGAPGHPRAPEALLAMANSQAEMKDTRGARRTLEELLKTYPASEAAQAGKQRLASLK